MKPAPSEIAKFSEPSDVEYLLSEDMNNREGRLILPDGALFEQCGTFHDAAKLYQAVRLAYADGYSRGQSEIQRGIRNIFGIQED